MKTRPILFKAPMVRALLAGRKTQTRRVVKLRGFGPSPTKVYDWEFIDERGPWTMFSSISTARLLEKCPHGGPGDTLWVRETHALLPEQLVIYKADGPADEDAHWTWRPSIHMPRWASRITLRVTDVRVERLQDITEEEAKAEGVESAAMVVNGSSEGTRYRDYLSRTEMSRADVAEWFVSPVDSYRSLWDSINGPGAWDANPWVWRVGFEKVTP